jgi:hypothetical protein
MPSYGSCKPSIIRYNGYSMKELPINTQNIYGQKIVFTGGGYFRLFPYALIKHWAKKTDYIMSYFHPRDLDPDQPVLDGLSLIRHFKSYVGLKGAENKLLKWLNDFDFIDISTADKLINWESKKIIQL